MGTAVVGLGLGLVVAEALTRAVLAVPAVQQAVHHRHGPASFRLAWLADDRDDVLFGRWYAHDPGLGWVSTPGTREVAGHTVTVDDRRRRAVPPPTGPDPVDWTLVGDSFTFGDDAPDEETWAWQLAETRPDLAVHDLGVSGYGLEQAVLRAEAEGVAGGVWVLATNAVMRQRLAYDFYTYAKPTSRVLDGVPGVTGVPVPRPEVLRAALQVRPRLAEVGRMIRWTATRDDPAREARLDGLEAAWVDRFVASARAADAEPWVVWLPVPTDYVAEDGRPTPAHRRPGALGACEAAGAARCLDLHGAFAEAQEAGVALHRAAHWTAAGHALVAEALAEAWAREAGPVPPERTPADPQAPPGRD